jgi:hypothetical protein
MHSHLSTTPGASAAPNFLVFNVLLGLLSSTPAVPGTMYRYDRRATVVFKAAGAVNSRNKDRPAGGGEAITVFQQVAKQYGKLSPMKDPWASTTSDISVAKKHTAKSKGYIYCINTAGIASSFTDVAAAYAARKETYPHPTEKEFSA